MKIIKTNFCQIFTSESNINSYSLEFDNYCVGIFSYKDLNIEEDFQIPTLIIGWDFIKNNFSGIKISKKKIRKNLFWTFSDNEEKGATEKDIKKFIIKSLEEYLPVNYRNFDCIIDGNVSNHQDKIFSQNLNFCFFSKNVIYVYNDLGFYGINLSSIDYIFESSNNFIDSISKKYRLIFFNYDNLKSFKIEDNKEFITLENICWICNNFTITETSLHKFSPYPLNEKYFVFLMSKFYDILNCSIIDNQNILSRLFKKDFITDWLSSRHINFEGNKRLILKYSNKRTITGRINCADKKFNPQLLPKNSEIRYQIISEFKNGKIVLFDFISFETKLSVYLTKDEVFIDKLKNSDLHIETSKIIFSKDEISLKERKIGKQINHAIIYGVGNDKLKSILLENKLSIKLIDKIKKFLDPIIQNSKKISDSFKKSGYIINPYNTIIYPNKEWAVYNNYVQSIAADIVVDKLFKIRELLKDRKSNFMYQVYDSFIFDIHPDEQELLENIKNILEKNGKYFFEVDLKIGKNLMECTEQNTEEEIEYIN
jgi:hypothetical protein